MPLDLHILKTMKRSSLGLGSPLDLHILKAMKRSPLGLDLCHTYLTFTLKRPLRLMDAG